MHTCIREILTAGVRRLISTHEQSRLEEGEEEEGTGQYQLHSFFNSLTSCSIQHLFSDTCPVILVPRSVARSVLTEASAIALLYTEGRGGGGRM